MLDALKNMLNQFRPEADSTNDSQNDVELALAALLFETMRMDHDCKPEEEARVLKLIAGKLQLDEAGARELMDRARQSIDEAQDYQQFTSQINREYSTAQRVRLLDLLWQVAYADGHLDPLEEAWIRKVADLMHLRHSEYIGSKLRVMESMGMH